MGKRRNNYIISELEKQTVPFYYRKWSVFLINAASICHIQDRLSVVSGSSERTVIYKTFTKPYSFLLPDSV